MLVQMRLQRGARGCLNTADLLAVRDLACFQDVVPSLVKLYAKHVLSLDLIPVGSQETFGMSKMFFQEDVYTCVKKNG